MKKIPLAFVVVSIATSLPVSAQLKEARVTQVIQDVKLLPGEAEARPAVVNDTVREGTAVRTGVESRTELTFADLTIARLGANTIFSFDKGTRAIDLNSGAVLLRVPKNSGGARINTAAVTAAITGTTVLAEYNCPKNPLPDQPATCPDALFKFITVEGSMRVCKNGSPNDCVVVGPGQMLVGSADRPLSDPVDVDVERLLETSLLIQGFPPLPSDDLMQASERDQLHRKVEGELIDSSTNIFGPGKLYAQNDPVNVETIDQRFAAEEAPHASPSPTPSPTPQPTPSPTPSPTPQPSPSPSPSPSPTPQPTPQKFGTPPVLTSGNLGVIDSTTFIQTDPTITRSGETGEGRIYRDQANDGALSAWFFTATSAFDTASGFDELFNAQSLPLAGFKFLTLTLAGDPTISTANGGALNLGLVSVGNLISPNQGGAAPAGTNFLHFTGIRTLLLGTQNGSIILGPEIGFTGLNRIIFHARGLTSDLLLGSPVTNVGEVVLNAERDVRVNGDLTVGSFASFAGHDFLEGFGQVLAGSIAITAGNDIDFTLRRFAVADAQGQTVSLHAGNILNLNTFGDQSVFARASSIFAQGDTINFFSSDRPGLPGGAGATIVFETDATVLFMAGPGGFLAAGTSFDHLAATNPFDIVSAGEILLRGIVGVDNMTAGTSFRASNLVITGTLSTGTFIDVGQDLIGLSSIEAGTTIDVLGLLNSPFVSAGGNVTADTVRVLTLEAPNGILSAGNGGIVPFLNSEGAAAQHTFTIDSILSPNGIDFSGNQFNGLNGNFAGGRLTIFARSLLWDVDEGIGATSFDGADFTMQHPFGGDGGVFIANATEDIFVGEFITATTGLNAPGTPFGGAGGTITLNAGGQITVNSALLVSSNDVQLGLGGRHSNSGGEINLHSSLLSGAAITLTTSSQLLSFLDDAATGPGGIIRVTTDGGNIAAEGLIVAQRGTVIISNGDTLDEENPAGGPTSGFISLDNGAVITAETLLVSAGGDLNLGLNGSLTLDATTISFSALNDLRGGVVDLTNAQTLFRDAVHSDGNVKFLAGGNISLQRLSVARRNAGRQSGVNLVVDAGGSLMVTNDLDLATDASGLTAGGNISVSSGGDISIGAGVGLRSQVRSDLGTGANILVDSGGNLTAGLLGASVFVDDANLATGGNITLNTVGNATFTSLTGDFEGLTLSILLVDGATLGVGGNISATIGGNLLADRISATVYGFGAILDGGRISFDITGNLTTRVGDARFIVAGTQITSAGAPQSIVGPGHSIHVLASNIAIGNSDFQRSLTAYIDDSGGVGLPSGMGGPVMIESLGTITLFGTLEVLGTVSAGGSINAATLASTNVISNTLIAAGQGGITRFGLLEFGAPVDLLHTLTAPMVTSQGGVDFNGLDADGDFAMATSGGALTINASTVTVGFGGILGSVTLNGGSGSGVPGFAAASGGALTVNTSGAIDVLSDIEATTGVNAQGAGPSGNGGSVTLNSTTETVNVNARIEVSSAPATASPTPSRRSNTGGNINITSGKAGAQAARAVAVNIGNSSQLLALLDAAATGPGGKVTILATGAQSDVNVAGRTEATRGTIDIRHQGDGGNINLGAAAVPLNPAGAPPAILSADVIKAGAFGANGRLNIGNSTLSANTLIRLYATGSNGELNFIANTTLSSGSRIDLAANTVTIQPNVIVNIVGAGGPANVFTNNANYSGFGGTNPANGTFSGNGANAPQPLVTAPPFDNPPPPRPPPSGTGSL